MRLQTSPTSLHRQKTARPSKSGWLQGVVASALALQSMEVQTSLGSRMVAIIDEGIVRSAKASPPQCQIAGVVSSSVLDVLVWSDS